MELTGIAHEIWDDKYRFKKPDGEPIDATVYDTFRRVATALAQPENKSVQGKWMDEFFDFSAIPAGRIIAGAGTGRNVTLMNCYVMGTVPDSLDGIHDILKQSALTMQQGGGIGTDFSTLRPQGALIKSLGSTASGPISFMDNWDSMCSTIMSAGHRRGAMMGTLRIDHPDIEAFIEAKRDSKRLRNFNISVLVTDDFMGAVRLGDDWSLQFAGRVHKVVKARDLWDKIMRSTYDFADPGVIFIDRVNAANPLRALELLSCTNPCGEQPLPPYGACCLGSINIARMVVDPFTKNAHINWPRLERAVRALTRMLDNVIDVTNYPLQQQREEMMRKRRIGVGITGLADALAMLGLRYSSQEAVAMASTLSSTVAAHVAEEQVRLGEEKGSFPLFDPETYDHPFAKGAKHKRGSHGTSIAPTGTISLFAGNISSGIEPIFDLQLTRRIRQRDDSYKEVVIRDYAYQLWCDQFAAGAGVDPDGLVKPIAFRDTVANLEPEHHLAVLTACTPNVDSSISKTINLPEAISYDAFKEVYLDAYRRGAKSCTTYRPNKTTGSILSSDAMSVAQPASNVVELTKPLTRPGALQGTTYRLKPGHAEHAFFITINNIEENGRWRPFEMFINTKNLESLAWSTALTRMISAIFRRGGDMTFVVDELCAVFDPHGGGYWDNREYVPSVIAGVGRVVKQHLSALGHALPAPSEKKTCPKCHSGMLLKEGCWCCSSCTHTACG
jgi:ribonucleoside-diphosphate reductase alpha chain